MIEDHDFPFSIFYPRLVSSLRAGTQCEFPSSKSEDQGSRPFQRERDLGPILLLPCCLIRRERWLN